MIHMVVQRLIATEKKEKEMNLMEKLLLTPSEAAELYSVSRSKMYALIKAGRIPCVKLEADHLLRVPLEGLKELIQQSREGSATTK